MVGVVLDTLDDTPETQFPRRNALKLFENCLSLIYLQHIYYLPLFGRKFYLE